MASLKFSFGNALTHFSKTEGPKGFLTKFVLAYVAVQGVLQGIGIFSSLPIYEVYVEMFAGTIPMEDVERKMAAASNGTGVVSLLLTPLALVTWMVFEGASQRRYIYGDGFRLRLGNDEWRLLVVGLLWVAIFFVAYIAFALMVGVPVLIGALSGSSSAMLAMSLIAGVLGLVSLFGVLYFVTRFSPAAALTVRDKSIRFFEAWTLTRGRVWPLLGANLVLWILSIFGVLLFYAGIIALVVIKLGPAFDGGVGITSLAAQPSFWVPAILLAFAWVGFMGILQHVMAGPAALAAKDDPNWIGNAEISNQFS